MRRLGIVMALVLGVAPAQAARQIVVEDFESAGAADAWLMPPLKASLSNEQAHSGAQSMRIDFDGPDDAPWGRDKDTAMTLPLRPSALGMWIWSDGGGGELNVMIRDSQKHYQGTGEQFMLERPVTLDFDGWRYVEWKPLDFKVWWAPSNRRWDYPLIINRLLIGKVTPGQERHVFIDDITVVADVEPEQAVTVQFEPDDPYEPPLVGKTFGFRAKLRNFLQKPVKLDVKWSLACGGLPSDSGATSVTLGPSESRSKEGFIQSRINANGKGVLVATCQFNGQRKAVTHNFTAFRDGEQRSRVAAAARDRDFLFYTSQLSPGVYVEAKDGQLVLFGDLDAWALEPPSMAAYVHKRKIATRPLRPYFEQETLSLDEPWVLLWFHGAKGWDKLRGNDIPGGWGMGSSRDPNTYALDVPMLVVLPEGKIDWGLSAKGLLLKAKSCGIMPLFGLHKLGQSQTAGWSSGLPAEVVERCRWWAQRLLPFPIELTERFTVDELHDEVRVDVDVKALDGEARFAPVPPALALARDAGMKIPWSTSIAKTTIATAVGPMHLSEKPSYACTIPGMLRYVLETDEVTGIPNNALTLDLRRRHHEALVKAIVRRPDWGWEAAHGASVWVMCRNLKYLTAEEREKLRPFLDAHGLFLFDLRNYRYVGHDVPRDMVFVNHSGSWTDVEPWVGEIMAGMWAYAYYLDQWPLVERAWPMIRSLFCCGLHSHTWNSLHSDSNAGDSSHDWYLGLICYARMARTIGQLDDYQRACCLLAQQLAGWYGLTKGAVAYAAQHPPWGATGPLPGRKMFYTVWGESAGLRFYEYETLTAIGEQLPRLRGPVARFYRDHLNDWVAGILDYVHKNYPDWYIKGRRHKRTGKTYVSGSAAAMIEASAILGLTSPAELVKQAKAFDSFGGIHAVRAWGLILESFGKREHKPCIPQAGGRVFRQKQGMHLWASGGWPCSVLSHLVPERGKPRPWPLLAIWGLRPQRSPRNDPAGGRLPLGTIRVPEGKPALGRSTSPGTQPNWVTSVWSCTVSKPKKPPQRPRR